MIYFLGEYKLTVLSNNLQARQLQFSQIKPGLSNNITLAILFQPSPNTGNYFVPHVKYDKDLFTLLDTKYVNFSPLTVQDEILLIKTLTQF